MRRATVFLAVVLGAGMAMAQKPDQVKWSLNLEPATAPSGSKILARLTAKIDPGWHMYSLTPVKGANIPTTIKLLSNPAVASYKVFQPAPHRALDKNFGVETETYEGQAAFLVEIELKKDAPQGQSDISLQSRYQVCSDRECIPPVRRTATSSLTIKPGTTVAAVTIPSGYAEPGQATPPATATSAPAPASMAPTPTAPVTLTGSAGAQGLGMFLLVAFGFGLAAVFTPCVFPMIPITMSYFLKKQEAGRRDGLFQAVVFCVGIIVLFSALGLITTAILGPFGVVQLGSNPWVNGFIALVFLAFGLSLLGAFEITIPSSILTKLDSASQRGGITGTVIMGLTFSLASFACVGPFVGTLLAASVQSGGLRPLLGMVSFATGLALPFFLLALFPSYLKRMPKSGGWLARVKVVMGFLILAAMLKYLSAIDQVLQLNWLTRDRFLAIWIVLFAMAGLYLLGFVRLEGVNKDATMGLGRLLTGMALLAFAISLIPGMFGGRLGDLDAYVPPASGPTAFSAAGESSTALVWMKNDYRDALTKARLEGKPVLVSFTGYACTNCHWMKANMFTRPNIAAAMKDYVLVELYTDGTDEVSRENQQLQESRFNTIAIPFYAILTPDEKVVATFPGLTRDPLEYLSFLEKGTRATGSAPATAYQRPAKNLLSATFFTNPFDKPFEISRIWSPATR